MSEELKPCPFCGDKTVYVYWREEQYFVSCNNCDCEGGKQDTQEEAIKAWNRRADDGNK